MAICVINVFTRVVFIMKGPFGTIWCFSYLTEFKTVHCDCVIEHWWLWWHFIPLILSIVTVQFIGLHSKGEQFSNQTVELHLPRRRTHTNNKINIYRYCSIHPGVLIFLNTEMYPSVRQLPPGKSNTRQLRIWISGKRGNTNISKQRDQSKSTSSEKLKALNNKTAKYFP